MPQLFPSSPRRCAGLVLALANMAGCSQDTDGGNGSGSGSGSTGLPGLQAVTTSTVTTSTASSTAVGPTTSTAASATTTSDGAGTSAGGSATTSVGGAAASIGGSATTSVGGAAATGNGDSTASGGLGGGATDSTTTSGGGTDAGGCGETSGLQATKIYYVAPSGSASGAGTSFASAMDFATAIAAVGPGELVLLEPGTYTVPYTEGAKNTLVLSKSGESDAPIQIATAACGRALFDFSFPEQAWVQDSYGFYVTGSYWYFKGIDITGAGYQGAYVTGQHNTFEACSFYENRNTGLEINKGGAYTTVLNCDAYRNYDLKNAGEMADGFAPKQTQGPGNRLIGCRAWENSDDGYDTYDSPEVVIIDSSWAFRNGVDVWGYGGFSGNGNGFKLGGNQKVAHHAITHSVAFGNVVKGFDQNNNAGGITVLNCLAYANGTNYGLGGALSGGELHFLRNNVSLDGPITVSNADAAYNSWDDGPSVSATDFLSLDLALATGARNPDGTLPESDLFRLAPGSALIDAGVDVQLPYAGSAPDLGAFEERE